MIPLRDNVPRRTTPVAVWILIGLNVAAFLFSESFTEQGRVALFYVLGVVPARYFDPAWAQVHGLGTSYWPVLTHMFLHSGWWHLIMNMWMLWIFADNVEDATGHVGFAAFYLLCGLAALATHLVFNLDAKVPVVGASGAIAGIMGAYFVLYPRGKVYTLIPIFFLPWFVLIPAPFFLGFWFLIQILSGLAGHAAGQPGGVAWWAHVGGFLAGAVLIRLFVSPKSCPSCYNRDTRHYEWR